ncbi:MAG: drug/metabolite transporter (DMT)-like permease, partial [Flavobacteriales bacterium]
GLFSVLNSLEIKKYDALNISLYELSAAAIGTFIFLGLRGDVNLDLVMLSTSDWGYMLLLGTIATAFAFVVSVEVMKVLTPFTVAISINLEPIYSIILALIIFGDEERMTPQFYIGAVIILGAIFIDAVLKRKSNRKQIGSNPV